MLLATVISAIAMMALAVPLVAERALSISGNAQAEAQRDAQMALRAMAVVARESQSFSFVNFGASPTQSAQVEFIRDPGIGPTVCFVGGQTFSGQLLMGSACGVSGLPGGPVTLIDGNRSQVTNMTITQLVPNQLVRVQLQVTHQPRPTSPRQETELLETDLFLRNGS